MRILKSQSFIVFALLTGTCFLMNSFSSIQPGQFHSDKEHQLLRHLLRNLPVQVNTYFAGSGLCNGCHGHDPNGLAGFDSTGVDINVADDWAGTMMANSAKDPLWRAKVSHEILVNPTHQDDIENTCTRCHAPLGKFDAHYSGITDYNIADMIADSVAMDGVSCSACHQMKDTLIGKVFSGQMEYDTTHTIYGPFTSPFAGPMQSFIGFNPVFGAHINKAGLCAGCHTLITPSLDLSGNPTGNQFVEQATYHEWVNSDFNNEVNPNGISCQGCHIPRVNEKIIIAANYAFLPGRKPFGKHHLVGANSFMLKLMRNNMVAVGITTQSKNLDSAIVRTNRLMQDSSVVMSLTQTARVNDTVYYDLSLTNKAGHKFPSGYPSRRAWVEFVVMDDAGDTIFKTGILNSNYQLVNEDATFEPHYNMINSEQQVQIYQMVMGDVNSNVTSVLQRADVQLKDNRLTPQGFTSTHFAYDTVKIIGSALTDPDFNKNGVVEGTGRDILHFHIPLNGYTDSLNVTAKFYYQSVPHNFLTDMFTFSSPEISSFQSMFNTADHTPLLVAGIKQGELFSGTPEVNKEKISFYPNPTHNNNVFVKGIEQEAKVYIYDLSGKTISVIRNGNVFTLPHKGTFIFRISQNGKTFTQKVISL